MYRSIFCFASILFAIFGLGWPASSSAADLTELVPADAIAVVSWRGMKDGDPAYAESRLKGMLEQTDLGGRVRRAYTTVFEEYARESEDAQVGRDLWREVYPLVWETPWVLYFEGITADELIPGIIEYPDGTVITTTQRSPTPRVGLIVEPGEHAAVIGKWMLKLHDLLREEEPHLDVKLIDDGKRLALLIGSVWADDREKSLTAVPRFTSSVADLSVDTHVTLYVDVSAVRAVIQPLVRREADGRVSSWAGTWLGLIGLEPQGAAMGTDDLDRVAWAGGFNGRDWEQTLFLAAPAPRRGLLSLLDQAPFDEPDLADIPASATWFTTTRLDIAVAWDTALNVAAQLNENPGEVEDRLRHEFSREFGFDLRDDLLTHLGDVWTVYADPSFAGMFGSNVALVHRVRDAEKIEATLRTLTQTLNEQLQQNGGLTFVEQQRDGATLHTLTLPFVSPTWAVIDGRLIVGFSPQTITAAVEHTQTPEAALLAARQHVFERLLDRMPHAHKATNLRFSDYERTAANAYSGYAMGLGLLGMQAQGDLPFNPAELLPPLADFTPYLSPGASVSWVDDAGYHRRSIMPFPGATMLSPDAFFGGPSLPMLGLGAAAMVPVLGGDRITTRVAVSNSNVRQLLLGLFVYASEHGERLPLTLIDVFEYTGAPDVFFAPGDPNQVFVGGPDNEHVRQLLRKHSSYVFTFPGVSLTEIKNSHATIMLVEHPRVQRPDGRHVVGFADGHTEVRLDFEETRRLIEEQTGQPLEHWIEHTSETDVQPELPAG